MIKHSAFCLSLVSPKYMGMVRKAFVIFRNETDRQIEVDAKDEQALCLAAVEAFEREGGARRLMDEKCLQDFSITFRCGTSTCPWLSWYVKMF